MSHPAAPRGRTARLVAAYGALLLAAAALFLLIRAAGEGLVAPPPVPVAGPAGGAGKGSMVVHLLLALAAILAASSVLGALFRRFGQPAVIGEVLAGILLGPSLLGQVAPGAAAFLFPESVTPLLNTLAQIGILLFMFVVGLELDIGQLRREAHAAIAISQAGIVVPFLLGSALALWLYPMLSSSDVRFTAFALFLGASMSVTAFPVLARILKDRGLEGTDLGTLALVCAAAADVIAWCLLAFVVGVIQSRLAGAGLTALLTVVYLAVMFWGVRPFLSRFVHRYQDQESAVRTLMPLVCLILLLSSLATEYIGIHTLFGAFLLGALIPHDSTVARLLRERLHDLVVAMFLPAFFAFSGLRTRIDLIEGGQWVVCAVIILVACLGKFGGSFAAARLCGMPWRRAASIGILMNTRGLVELIILNVGLDLGIISPTLFAMMVLMALVTTFATTPILDWLTRREAAAPEGAAAPAGAA